jgi:hypothetical protein
MWALPAGLRGKRPSRQETEREFILLSGAASVVRFLTPLRVIWGVVTSKGHAFFTAVQQSFCEDSPGLATRDTINGAPAEPTGSEEADRRAKQMGLILRGVVQ